MKKIFLNFTAFLFITVSAYSQDFYFGFSPGLIKGVYSKTEDGKYFRSYMDVRIPTGNFIFSVLFKNNFELETGIMYYPYPYNMGSPADTIGGKFDNITPRSYEPAYHSLSFPIHIGYKFKLANRLYANIYSGLNFDFYFRGTYVDDSLQGFPPDTARWNVFGDCLSYTSIASALKQRFNILFSNRVSLQYFTKFNMGISLYAAYYSGLFSVWESNEYLKY
jgi:hypothetical protein